MVFPFFFILRQNPRSVVLNQRLLDIKKKFILIIKVIQYFITQASQITTVYQQKEGQFSMRSIVNCLRLVNSKEFIYLLAFFNSCKLWSLRFKGSRKSQIFAESEVVSFSVPVLGPVFCMQPFCYLILCPDSYCNYIVQEMFLREKVQVFVLRQLWEFEIDAETADYEKRRNKS